MKEIKNSRKGFTLLELLVVVIIIGILAAIALPQYNKAVEKARASEAFVLLQAMVKAKDVYDLSNDENKVPELDELDIEITGEEVTFWDKTFVKTNNNFLFGFTPGALVNPHAVRVDDNNNVLYYLAYYMMEGYRGFYCIVRAGSHADKYVEVCKSLGGIDAGDLCTGVNNGLCFKLSI